MEKYFKLNNKIMFSPILHDVFDHNLLMVAIIDDTFQLIFVYLKLKKESDTLPYPQKTLLVT